MKIKSLFLVLMMTTTTTFSLLFIFNRTSFAASHFSLIAAGDITPAGHLRQPGSFFGPRISKKIAEVDTFFWNCETSGPSSFSAQKKFVFKTNEAILSSFIIENGLAGLANNHILDGGKEGFSSLIHLFEKLQGDIVFGLVPKEKKGKAGTAHFFAWTAMYGKMSLFPDSEQFFTLVAHQRLVTPDDFIVVYLHDGTERETTPTSRQRFFLQKLTTAGADAILFAHSHVYGSIQPPEKIGEPLVIWNMGNAIFGGNRAWENKKDVRFAEIRLSRDMPHTAKWVNGSTVNWKFEIF